MAKPWRREDGGFRRLWMWPVARVVEPLILTAGAVAVIACLSLSTLDWQRSAEAFHAAPPCPVKATVSAADSAACVLTTRATVAGTGLDESGPDETVDQTLITLVGPALTNGQDTVSMKGDEHKAIASGTVVPVTVWHGSVMRFTVLGSEHLPQTNPDRRLSYLRIVTGFFAVFVLVFARGLPRMLYEELEAGAKRIHDGLNLGAAALTVAIVVLAALGRNAALAWCGLAMAALMAAAGLMPMPDILGTARHGYRTAVDNRAEKLARAEKREAARKRSAAGKVPGPAADKITDGRRRR
jgi:hypothetical protein